MAAFVTASFLGVDIPVIQKTLSEYSGTNRRFDYIGTTDKGVKVIDDYAHHPTEIATTLRAARQTEPKRLICAFQPHRYSRTKLLAKEFGAAFAGADLLILTDVYAAGEAPIPGVSGETIFAEVVELTGQKVSYIEKREDVAPYLKTIAQPGDLIITMGAGDIWKTGEELAELLKE